MARSLTCKTSMIIIFPSLVLIFILFTSLTQQHHVSYLYSSSFPLHQSYVKQYFHSSPSSSTNGNLEHEPILLKISPSPSPSPAPSTAPAPSPSSTTSSAESSSNHDFFNELLSNSTSSNTATTDSTVKVIKMKTSVDKIEEGLAKARENIREAVRSRNVTTSDGRDDFIPKGADIYRNPYAFYQSHIEMEKRFKVWTYKEGEQPLVHDGPVNNIYSTEGQFIDEMESGKSLFIAKHPDEAHAFFLPFSVANVIRYIYKPITSFSRDRLQQFVEDYVSVVANRYPYWNRSSGADHFMVSCHDWSPQVSNAHPDLFKNFIRVLCNANTSEGFRPERDVTLPEINLPFGLLGQPMISNRPSKRTILAFFAGGAHGNIRKVLLNEWRGKDNDVQVYQYLPKNLNYYQLMGKSKYCLCASGYEVASPRVVEAIRAECVPVILSDSYVLPFSDVLDWSKFSVNIPVRDIPKIKEILQAIPLRKYLQMQNRLKQVQRHFSVNRPAKRFDVIHMVLHSVWLRRLNIGLLS
ncbi:probable glycosyltransferase At5g20260 [Papaver somniferum]|nr:probable glycosyltransferase At5g20260 [Papaver somniferum]